MLGGLLTAALQAEEGVDEVHLAHGPTAFSVEQTSQDRPALLGAT